jgi:hypothetical protein
MAGSLTSKPTMATTSNYTAIPTTAVTGSRTDNLKARRGHRRVRGRRGRGWIGLVGVWEVGWRRVEAGCEGRGEEWGGSVVPALAYSVCGLGRQVERERVVEVKGGDRICRQLAVEAGT